MDTRKKIMDTASRLFYAQGYNSTGINQVIKEAEVAKATLYGHFPSKEDLLGEYLRNQSVETMTSLRSVAAAFKTPKEKITGIFDHLIKHTQSSGFGGCNFLNIAAEVPEGHQQAKAIIKKQKDNIRQLFAEILKPAGKAALADQFYLLFDAALVTTKVYGDTWPAKTARSIAEKLL